MGVASKRTGKHQPVDQSYWEVFDAVGDGLIIQDAESRRVVEANHAAAAMHGYSREDFIGLDLAQYLHPESQPRFAESVLAVQSGGVHEATAIHVRRDGTPFDVEVRRTAFEYRGRPCLLSVVRDISDRVQAEQLLRQEVDAHQREQATLLDISRTLASSLELKPDLILDQLGHMVQYSRAALFVLEDSSLVSVAMRGVRGEEAGAAFRIALDGADTLAQLFNDHRPIRIADLASDQPKARFLRSVLAKAGPTLIEGVRAWMWVPLAAKDRLMGGIGIAQTEGNYFSAHHADLALTVANQAAITMINAELYRNAQSLAVLEERQHLARNLHDAVNQSLFSAGLIAEVLPRLWDRDQLEARRSLEDLRKLTRGAMAEMRALLAELRPSTLTDAHLGDLLRLLGNAFTGRTNVPATLTLEGEGALPAEVQVAAYRICQEALTNVAKYAKAGNVVVSLKQDDAAIQLSIRDDGQGFDPERTASGHYGLSMMQERADAIGARLSVTSRPGHGTEIALSWTASGKKDSS